MRVLENGRVGAELLRGEWLKLPGTAEALADWIILGPVALSHRIARVSEPKKDGGASSVDGHSECDSGFRAADSARIRIIQSHQQINADCMQNAGEAMQGFAKTRQDRSTQARCTVARAPLAHVVDSGGRESAE